MCSELKVKSPLSGMGPGQQVATVALALLGLITLVAFIGQQSHNSRVASVSSSTPFSSETYNSDSVSPSGSDPLQSSDGSASTSSGSDALGVVPAADLPQEARRTIELIDAGGPYPYSRDGVVFGNYEKLLPAQPRGWYREFTVKTPGASNRGARRIIKGQDGTLYYTSDHYESFRRVQR